MNTRRQMTLLFAAFAAAPQLSLAGAWSHESLANDGALDWVLEFQRQPTVSFVESTLLQGTTGEHIESFAGEGVIAAGEVVASALNRPSRSFPKKLEAATARSAKEFAQP